MKSDGKFERRFEMITSRRTERILKWLTTRIVIMLGLFPLCVTYAQNLDGVGERLRQAVAEGELTEVQASAMMDTLHHSVARDALETRIREIELAVEADEMTREEGFRAIEETKRAMEQISRGDRGDWRFDNQRNAEADRRYRHYAEIEARIERAVESGELSREEAERQLEEAHRELFGSR